MRLFCIALLGAIFGVTANAQPTLSKEEFLSWWNKHSTEEISIDGAFEEVHLKSKEVAYLVNVMFFGRGRNFMSHIAIARPSLQEVRELPDSFSKFTQVLDLGADNTSEVIVESIGSGQGAVEGKRSLIQIDGWTPVVLHFTEFGDNEGFAGQHTSIYRSREVVWKFVDLDGDGKLDLIEEITTQRGRNNREPKVSNFTFRYLFKNGKLVPLLSKSHRP